MAAFYIPPPPKNMNLVIPNVVYTPPTVTNIKIDLLILTEPIPITQNAFFLSN
jgi:hypothetical protein